jgi:SagB-type dehydrogenase family enzyme
VLFDRSPAASPLRGWPQVTYDQLFDPLGTPAQLVTPASIGHLLRHAVGLSAWKAIQGARWALRVNPSSGNLHPTEAYVVTGPLAELGAAGAVWHYAPDRHAIEQRCAFAADAWSALGAGAPSEAFLVVLTSIHWREAWKYGERAFRYCQHDLGHAIAACSLAASLLGWRVAMLPGWPHQAIAALAGIDRDEDYFEAEREEPACVMCVSGSAQVDNRVLPDARFLDAVRSGQWFGRASQLSEDHIQWTFIDEVARATADPGGDERLSGSPVAAPPPPETVATARSSRPDTALDARAIILQRRSAVALDGRSWMQRADFFRVLGRTLPDVVPPWRTLWWSPRIHLAVLVHRVTDISPGLYLLCRADAALPALRAALRPDFTWERVEEGFPLWLLQAGDVRARAARLSCDQQIAADGFFSLGMIAEFEQSLVEHGPLFYRQLFWESGVVGQVLYLEAEATGARGTGIGCFYDDPVHRALGIEGHAFQSIYHFTVGIPVEDRRLTTEPGYTWEREEAAGAESGSSAASKE